MKTQFKFTALLALLFLLLAPVSRAQTHRFDSLLGPNVASITVSNSAWLTNCYPQFGIPAATNTPNIIWTNANGVFQTVASGDSTPLLGDAALNPFRDGVSQTNITIVYAVKGGLAASGGLTFTLAPIWAGPSDGATGMGITQTSVPFVDNNTNFTFNIVTAASQYLCGYTNIVIPPGVKGLRLITVKAPTSSSYYQLFGVGIPSWQQ